MCKSSFTRIANWHLTGEDWGKLDWQGTGSGMKLTNQTIVEPDLFEAGITAATDTDPETEYTLHLTVADNNMGVLLAKILYYTDEEHQEYETLESAELIPGTNEISLNFTAPADSVWLLICRPAEEGIDAKGKTLTVISATMYKYNWTVSQLFIGSIGLQSNPYRFAYNGMERMDEKAGRANHYTALYSEYDVRKVLRENLDPKPNPSMSPYSMFSTNPIWFNDPLGDTIRTNSEGAKNVELTMKGILGKKTNPITYNENNSELEYNDKIDISTYSKFQKEILGKYKSLIKDEVISNLKIVDREKDVVNGEKTLADFNANGLTIGKFQFDKNGLKQKLISQDIFIARDPKSFHKSTSMKLLKPEYAGITNIYEVGGHGFLNLTQPKLKTNTHNELVEKLHKQAQENFKINGSIWYKRAEIPTHTRVNEE